MRTLGLLLCLALPLAATAQGQEHVVTERHQYAFDPDGEISVENYKGSIAILGWDRPEVRIEVRIEAEDFDGLVMLPEVEILIGGSVLALEVETDYRKAVHRLQQLFGEAHAKRLPLVHYVISMPRTARLKIDDYMSTIDISDLQSTVEVYTYKGEVAVTKTGGGLKLDMFRGRARIAFEALTRDSSIDTVEGAVAIEVPRDAGFDLALRLEAPHAAFAADSSLAPPGRIRQGYQGSINGGGPLLHLVTTSGSFRLSTP